MNQESSDRLDERISPAGSIGQVRLWTVDLSAAPRHMRPAADTLSDDERVRASRFRFDVHRRRFVAARAALRTVLADVVGTSPARICFQYSVRGKPSLADGLGAPEFNLSHSDDLAVIAVSVEAAVGVDVECIRPVAELEGIISKYFSPAEQAVILADAREAPHAFFRYWTLKEAWLKTDGTGLSGLVSSVEVIRAPDGTARLRHVGGAALPYVLHEWVPRPGFAAALAVASIHSPA